MSPVIHLLEEVRKLSAEDKIVFLDSLWENETEEPPSQEIVALLEERWKRVESGEAKLYSIEEAQNMILGR